MRIFLLLFYCEKKCYHPPIIYNFSIVCIKKIVRRKLTFSPFSQILQKRKMMRKIMCPPPRKMIEQSSACLCISPVNFYCSSWFSHYLLFISCHTQIIQKMNPMIFSNARKKTATRMEKKLRIVSWLFVIFLLYITIRKIYTNNPSIKRQKKVLLFLAKRGR